MSAVPAAVPVRPGGDGVLLSGLLLAPLLLLPALALAGVGATAATEPLPWLVLGALLLGLLLDRAHLPVLAAHPIALLSGAAASLWSVSGGLPSGSQADAVALLLARLDRWFAAALVGQAGPDELLFAFSVALLAWLVAYLAAFAVFRYASPWWPIAAGGAVMLATTGPGQAPGPTLYVFLGAALLLVVRLTAVGHRRRWLSAGVGGPSSLPTLVLPPGAVVVGLLLLAAFLLPTHQLEQRALDPFRVRLETTSSPLGDARVELERLIAEARGEPETAPYPLAGFGGAMTLQGEFHMRPDPVAHVAAPQARYWRAVTYQEYTGRGWRNRPARRDLPPAPPRPSSHERRDELRQSVRVLAARGGALLTAAEPRSLSLAATLEYPVGLTGDPLALDLVSGLHAPAAAVVGSTYRVVSAISTARPADLRAAGADYPAAVGERYGRVPETTERVRELARRLAPPELTPYDRAVAVEAYLRGLRYELRVPTPPSDRDGVDYFLFDSRVGYCDYFASAMAVMLRSAGVPARVASGYAAGEPDGRGGWLVRDLHAHSWVEVYFPRYGWVEFEPSPNRPLPDRPGGTDPAAERPPPVDGPPAGFAEGANARDAPPPAAASPTPALAEAAASLAEASAPWLPNLVPYLTGLLALAGVAAVARLAWGWGIDGLPLAEAGYARMARLARLLGAAPRPGQTPTEFAASVAARYPAAGEAARTLASAFVESRWGARTPPVEPGRLELAWREVRRALLAGALARLRPAGTAS